ncbi:hypothetical protein [Micromonospora sp. NPDC051006]|uniref:hypothetical protein n=1 Tax=Micromonospora sp. NPDC051006 TaxID=3364283 RepID=UPI0037A99EF7
MTAMEDSPDSPTPPSSVVETSAPAATPTRTKAPATSATSSAPRLVTAGAFCDTAGQTGVTKGGTAMVCKGPGDLRWRRP